jgi:hypothetical protein
VEFQWQSATLQGILWAFQILLFIWLVKEHVAMNDFLKRPLSSIIDGQPEVTFGRNG